MLAENTLLDPQDQAILDRRVDLFNQIEGPRDGDYIIFSDGVERRVSHVTPEAWLPDVDCVQTSKGGSWYLAPSGHTSFSGSLYAGVPRSSLTETTMQKEGPVWFFHHDEMRASNDVNVLIMFRIFECDRPATS